ncbi:MAG TPA: phosphoadenosine phosphosulfate reductase family protein [Nitrosospira sp.]|nr:phosphoadenosine phosphosulfate reductase family protein [Nitrosospira sp.]
MRILALSGGKDSMACLHLMQDSLDCAIYVDTGKAYPETDTVIEYAKSLIQVITVHSDRDAQNQRQGIPAEVVPVDWTREGQAFTGHKPALIQSYLTCCFENIGLPLFLKAQELGATELVYGQRNEDNHKSSARDGDVISGIKRIHPIEDWTTDQVIDYLDSRMEVPAHYYINHSSLDCYDCTAYRRDSQDRIKFTKERYPRFYLEYLVRKSLVNQALIDSGYMETTNA